MAKKLSVIIPVLNEAQTLTKVLARVDKAFVRDYQKEIIIVDDGSIDQTEEILKELKPGYIIFRHPRNLGKGAAIQTGLTKASGDLVIIQDADLEYDPEDWPALIKELESSGCDAVYGSRNLNARKKGYQHYVFGVWFLTLVNNLLFGSRLTDIYTCYKLLPRKIVESLDIQSRGFEFEAEITAKLLKKGYQIEEAPISYNPRSFKQGKKIRFKDGVKGLWTLLRCRFG